MDFQTVIVGIIFIFAGLYVGKMIFGKLKSFSTKKQNCGNNCGCDSTSLKTFSTLTRK